MLRAAAQGLHRAPHVASLREQIPACGHEIVRVDTAAVVQRLGHAGRDVGQHARPHDVAVALDDHMRAAQIAGFVGIKRGVNAPVDHRGSTCASERAELVTAQGIACMNADTDHVACLHRIQLELLEGFIGNAGIAELRRGCACEHEQPAGGNHADAE